MRNLGHADAGAVNPGAIGRTFAASGAMKSLAREGFIRFVAGRGSVRPCAVGMVATVALAMQARAGHFLAHFAAQVRVRVPLAPIARLTTKTKFRRKHCECENRHQKNLAALLVIEKPTWRVAVDGLAHVESHVPEALVRALLNLRIPFGIQSIR